MPNPWTDASRDDRWEVGVPELNMDQLRAPTALRWLKHEGKPADASLGTFALSSMFNDAIIKRILTREYFAVTMQIVRTWPELLTAVRDALANDARLTVVSEPDGSQKRPLAKGGAR